MSVGRTGLVANIRSFVRHNRAFIAVLLVFLMAVPVAYSFRSGQSYLIDARTLGARIEVEGVGTSWQLRGVTHCVWQTDPDLAALRDAARAETGGADRTAEQAQAAPACNPVLFPRQTPHRAVAFALPDGATIAMSTTPEGGLRLSQPGDGARREIGLGAAGIWAPDDVLIVSPDGWRDTGALEFQGNVWIGDAVAQGAQGYLLEGSYEIRERFRRQQALQAIGVWLGWQDALGMAVPQPIPILTGDLMRGDQVTFERHGRPGRFGICRGGAAETGPAAEVLAATVPAQGFVVPVLDDDLSGFALRVTSNAAAACVRLRLNSYGAQPRYVAPTWTDRALLDPLLLAVLAIGGFLVGFLTLLVEIAEIVRQREEAAATPGAAGGPGGGGQPGRADSERLAADEPARQARTLTDAGVSPAPPANPAPTLPTAAAADGTAPPREPDRPRNPEPPGAAGPE